MASFPQCSSIRGAKYPGERCGNRAKFGEWCGHHKFLQVRWAAPDTITHVVSPGIIGEKRAAIRIFTAWRRWLARRAGPLLWARGESNNPYDFFSSDPVEEIPLRDVVSFVDADRKGYIMDIKSATSLLAHCKKTGDVPTNPFNREPLPAQFLHRIALHGPRIKGWTALVPQTEAQALGLAATDVFRHFDDLGYYTDPAWFLELSRAQLQQLYIEIADIWYHRATLSPSDRIRIVPPPVRILPMPVTTVLVMTQKALQKVLLESCRLLVSASSAKSDRQLGAMYVLGALAIVSGRVAVAYPWLAEMFTPGITRILPNGQVSVLHPSVLVY